MGFLGVLCTWMGDRGHAGNQPLVAFPPYIWGKPQTPAPGPDTAGLRQTVPPSAVPRFPGHVTLTPAALPTADPGSQLTQAARQQGQARLSYIKT